MTTYRLDDIEEDANWLHRKTKSATKHLQGKHNQSTHAHGGSQRVLSAKPDLEFDVPSGQRYEGLLTDATIAKIRGIQTPGGDIYGESHKKYIEVGRLIREQIEVRQATSRKILEELRVKETALVEEHRRVAQEMNGVKEGTDRWHSLNEEDMQIYEKLHKLWDRTEQHSRRIHAELSNATYAALQQLRPFGGKHRFSPSSDDQAVAMLESEMKWFPSDWVAASSRKSSLLATMSKPGERAHYSYSNKEIAMDRDGDTARHELGHRFEDVITSVKAAAFDFYRSRTQNEMPKWLGPGYGINEISRKDKFSDPYIGKVYNNATEVISMAMGRINRPELIRDRDPRHWDLIVGLLATAPAPRY